jgi:hypothetical protein
MAWVEFLRDFPYIPPATPARTIVYPAGAVVSVTRHCAGAAVAARAARKTKTPSRAQAAALQASG